MRLKKAGMVAAITFALLLLVIVPFFRNDENQEQSLRTQKKEDHTVQLLNVDSIHLYESTQRELNTDDSFQVIIHETGEKSHYVDNQVVVDFNTTPTDQTINNIAREIDGKVINTLESHYIFDSNTKSANELIQFFTEREDVEYAEPNFIYMQNSEKKSNDFFMNTKPNDVFYNQYQWNLPMIQTENGWNISRGTEEIEIAVLDTGVDLKHPDLIHRISKGYNVIEENNKPEDDNGHGTHVSGVIASETDNNEGIAGITWFNRVMPVKVMGSEGYGSTMDIATGIAWATDHGADVINMSLGNYRDSDLLHEAIRYAFDHDVVIIAASGNDNTNQPSYPAAYPEVLSVAAVDYYGDRASFSNYGPHIDVSAPGVQIPSTYIGQQYAALSGTSMATPHVAALAGLIRSVRNDLSNEEVMAIIRKTAYDIGTPGHDIYFGQGIIDIAYALEEASNY